MPETVDPVDLYAPLLDRPYHLSWAQIADLTDRQIVDKYYRPRDKDGKPITEAERAREEKAIAQGIREPKTLDEVRAKYESLAAALKMSPEQVEAGWQKYLEKQNVKAG